MAIDTARPSNVPTVLPLLGALLLSCGGCDSSDGPGDARTAPALDLIFPGKASLTDADRITVVVVAEPRQVSSVTIKNGAHTIVATLDIDGRWRADGVPLERGLNTLVAELKSIKGGTTARNIAVVESSPVMSMPWGVSFDAVSNRVLIADASQLLAFDPAAETLEVISSGRIGAGPHLHFAQSVEVAGDGGIFVGGFAGVLRVDSVSGDRTEHVEFAPLSIALDRQLNRLFMLGFGGSLYVADLNATPPIPATTVRPPPGLAVVPDGPMDSAYMPGIDSIYSLQPPSLDILAIDGASGALSNFLLRDSGGNFIQPVGISYDAAGDRLIVLGSSGTLYSFDPRSGSTSALASAAGSPKAVRGLAHGNGELWTLSLTPSELIRIDATTGAQTVEVHSGVGAGAAPQPMALGRYDAATNRFVALFGLRVAAIDVESGSRTILADLCAQSCSGVQPRFFSVSGIALSRNRPRAWVTDQVRGTLAEVDLDSGAVVEISGPTAGAGPLPGQIVGIALSTDESIAYLADRFARRIFRVDLVTGQRDLLPEFAAGLDSTELRGLVLDAPANRLMLYVAPSRPTAAVGTGIYSLDLSSFQLSLVADLSTVVTRPFAGTPARSFPMTQMSLSADGSALYVPVSADPDVSYLRVDVALGTVAPLGDPSSALPVFVPTAMEAADDGRLFALDWTSALYLIDTQTRERVIVSK